MSATETEVQATVEDAPPERDWEGEARQMGWAPKDTFKGDPIKWVDAKTYVERGESFIPLLQHSNKELKSRLATIEEQNFNLGRQLALANKGLEELKEDSREGSVETAETKKAALYDQIAVARENNDVRGELQLREQLDDLNAEIRELKVKPAAAPPLPSVADAGNDPRIVRFKESNPWFGVDNEKSSMALGYLSYLVQTAEGKAMTPEERFAAVSKRMNELYGSAANPRRNAPSRVEGSRPDGASSRSANGRSYEDMPADAKAQCDKQAQRFVGKPNAQGATKYRDLNDYRASYAAKYFDTEWGTKQMNA